MDDSLMPKLSNSATVETSPQNLALRRSGRFGSGSVKVSFHNSKNPHSLNGIDIMLVSECRCMKD